MSVANAKSRGRPAYSLIELLAVIAILAILAGLTTAAVIRFRNTGPRAATRSNLGSLKAKSDAQWKSVRERAMKENIPSPSRSSILLQRKNAGIADWADPEGVRSAYVDFRLRQAFPMDFGEALQPGGTPPWQPYLDTLNRLGLVGLSNGALPWQWDSTQPNYNPYVVPAGRAPTLDVQRSICLMLALEIGPSNVNVTPEALGTTAALQLRANVASGAQAYGVVDAWKRPVVFFRVATAMELRSAGEDGIYGVNITNWAPVGGNVGNDDIVPSAQ